jgi:tetratricopeptide (TPR) repeat protein
VESAALGPGREFCGIAGPGPVGWCAESGTDAKESMMRPTGSADEWERRRLHAVGLPQATPAGAPEPLLWGGLEPGPHAVGFRALYQLDHTRQYDPEYVDDPERPPDPRPRPILVGVWYPARATGAGPMAYRQYLDVPSDDPLVGPFARRLMPHMRAVACEEAVGNKPGALTPAEAAAVERLLAAETVAVKDAPAADGRFPVVIYHPGLGGTYEDNSALFEYLASHGYVVLSSAYPRADAGTMHIDWDLTRSFRDMELLSRYARGQSFADADRLAAIGHSYGAQAALAWRAEPASSVRAVVSIDSTVENVGIDHPGFAALKTHLQANKLNLRAPTLRFASRASNPDFATLEPYLKLAPRYEATVASLEHNDYLTHGAIGPALMPEKWPDAERARRVSYDRVCEHVLRFLDATLKQRAEAREFLQRSVRGEELDEGFRLQFRRPAPEPPTARQLALLVRRHGVGKAAELLRSCRDDVEVGGDGVGGAGAILLDDGQVEEALALFTRAADIFPKSMAVHANLGEVLARTGDREGAVAAYRRGMELVPGEIGDEGQRAQWLEEFERELEKLGWGKEHPGGR